MTMFLNWLALNRARERTKARERWRKLELAKADLVLACFPVPCPHKSFKFVFCTEMSREERKALYNDDSPIGTASFRVIEMPSNVVEELQKGEILLYRPHDHRSCSDRERFRPMSFPEVGKARKPDNLIQLSNLAVVGSFMYALYRDEDRSIRFMSYDLSDGVMLSLPTPSSSLSNIFSCKVVTLRGKVYLLRGLTDVRSPRHPFAEVFDPTTNKWSKVTQPSHDAKRVSCGEFIASLGEPDGRLMVYNPSHEDVYRWKDTEFTLYFYDVNTDEWRSRSCSGFVESCPLGKIIGKEVVNEYDSTLYWLSTDGLIYALDWKNRRAYSCPIGGLEQVPMFTHLEYQTIGVSFHHLWFQFFCVVWCAPCSTESDTTGGTEYHYTFLRVIKNSSTKTMDAMVLGCFVNSYDYKCRIFDAVRV